MDGGKPYVTDNDNYIVDLYFENPIKDAKQAAKEVRHVSCPWFLFFFGGVLWRVRVCVGGWGLTPSVRPSVRRVSVLSGPGPPPHNHPPPTDHHTPISYVHSHPHQTQKQIEGVVGVVEHGFFLDMTTAVIVAGKDGIEVINKK